MKFEVKSSLLFVALLALSSPHAIALPMLEEPIPLPAKFEGIITIYPDNHNTVQIQNFWLVPSTARIVRNPDKKLAFGLVHSGVSSFDPDGINALLNVSIQPYVDEKTLNDAKALIEQQAKAQGATSVNFRYVAPTESTARLLVGGQYYDWAGKEKTVVSGGLVEAGIPFQVKLNNASFDVRSLAQAGGDDASTFGVLYTMKFSGVRNRCDFDVTADFTETYKHFKAVVQASGWWGIAKGSAKTEWQTLTSLGLAKLNVRQCKQEDLDKFDVGKILNSFMEQLASRTGFFAKQLQPGGLPDAPGGGGGWGWSVSAGGGFESYDVSQQLKYAVDAQYTVEEEIAYGMSFPSGGPELKGYVRNLTDSNKPFPTSADFKKIAGQHTQCRKNNIDALKKFLADGTISQSLYDDLIQKTLTKGCYVDYTTNTLEAKLSSSFGRKVTLDAARALNAAQNPQLDFKEVVQSILSR